MSESGIVPSAEEDESMPQLPVAAEKFNGNVKITDAEAMKAARECGMIGLKVKRIKGTAKLGKYLEEAGVISVGRVHLLDSINKLSEADDAVVEDIGACKEMEVKAQLHNVRKGILETYAKASHAMIKSAVDQKEATIVPTQTMFDPDQDVRPAVTVNVNQAVAVQQSEPQKDS